MTRALMELRPQAFSLQDLWKNAVSLIIRQRRMGLARTIQGSVPEGTDPQLVRTLKTILDAEEIQRIARLDGRIRRVLGTIGLPAPALFKGMYFIPVVLMDRAERQVSVYLAERDLAVSALQQRYPLLLEEAQRRLGSLFRQTDYPPVYLLPELYKVQVAYYSFDTQPQVLDRIEEGARQEAIARGQAVIRQAVEEMRDSLRQTMGGLVSHLKARLTPDPMTGEAKVLVSSVVNNLVEFLELFESRNLTNDQELADLVQRAKLLVTGVDVPTLRQDASMREVVREGMADIEQQMDTLLVKKPKRRYDWTEEE